MVFGSVIFFLQNETEGNTDANNNPFQINAQ